MPAAQWTRRDFQRLIEPCIPRLYRLCLTLAQSSTEAEDLLQNSLVKAYIHKQTFGGRGSLLSWLYGIVRHEHLEQVRTHMRRRSLLEVALERCSDVLGELVGERRAEGTPEDVAIGKQEVATLLSCLRTLREPYRTVVLLCDVEELPYDEVAQILGVPVGTVKSRHARSRSKLRSAFERMQQRFVNQEAHDVE